MNFSLNVKSSSIVHTLLSNCVKLIGKVQKLHIQCINYLVISKRICVVSPKFYTVGKNFTGPPVPRSRQMSSLLVFHLGDNENEQNLKCILRFQKVDPNIKWLQRLSLKSEKKIVIHPGANESEKNLKGILRSQKVGPNIKWQRS